MLSKCIETHTCTHSDGNVPEDRRSQPESKSSDPRYGGDQLKGDPRCCAFPGIRLG
ncbi:hypothetical protein P171DRAFT_66240 [Karstenula rhodostoma CBS 690.94]|uniref:Uncharacterized protein n=1 Tax=Karstenula rhodostoma CBS 690.94 TaxID=1392251 RepID=A0A9P4U9U9_9PLEO|nr:hypothetical protein P171DRAFT_66240 [Karstenula rhodostoma CBS 690.94]